MIENNLDCRAVNQLPTILGGPDAENHSLIFSTAHDKVSHKHRALDCIGDPLIEFVFDRMSWKPGTRSNLVHGYGKTEEQMDSTLHMK